jgi:uncharacterized protein (TIGR02147 family)
MRAGIEYGLEKASATDPGLSIFDFNDYRKFLQAYYDYKKQRYYGFSYRSFNQAVGVRSPGLLLDLINARQNLTEKLHRKFAAAMRLNRQESDYFWLMVMLTHAKEKGDLKIKKEFQARMSVLKPSDAKALARGQESYLAAWYNLALREALGVLDIGGNAEDMAGFLNPEITVDQVRQSMELLHALGLIRRNRSGHWKPESPAVTVQGSEIPVSVVRRSQKNILDLSKRALDVFPRDERNISSMTFSASGEAMEKINEALGRFRKQVLEIIKEDEDPSRVYALSMALFPLSLARGG